MSRVIHFEIHAENPERAVKFYRGLFGWDIKKWELPEGAPEYWIITTGQDGTPGINGGLLRRHGTSPKGGEAVTSYVCTVAVEALDASLAKATSTGAVIATPKMAIPGVGWLAYCIDTEGNIFGLMQSDPEAK